MKKLNFALASLALCTLTFTSCSDNDPEETTGVQINLMECNLNYNANGVWTGWDHDNESLILKDFGFSHNITEWGSFEGFVPAKMSTDNVPESGVWYDNPAQFQVVTRGGSFGVGSPYIVAYWNTQETVETPLADRSCYITYSGVDASRDFSPVSVKVTNTSYTYNVMLNGNAFSSAFSNTDWLKLTAHGVAIDGTENTVDFYLADMAKGGIVTKWETIDLTPLGKVVAIYFTMESSDSGQWGMNTPSYFAIDQFTAKMYNY